MFQGPPGQDPFQHTATCMVTAAGQAQRAERPRRQDCDLSLATLPEGGSPSSPEEEGTGALAQHIVGDHFAKLPGHVAHKLQHRVAPLARDEEQKPPSGTPLGLSQPAQPSPSRYPQPLSAWPLAFPSFSPPQVELLPPSLPVTAAAQAPSHFLLASCPNVLSSL